jgi:hypothetical protein
MKVLNNNTNHMKKYFIFLTSLALLTISGPTAFAQTTVSPTLTKLIIVADKEINNRIETLNKISAKIGSTKKISTSTKEMVASTTQIEIINLTALKSKIDADTDEATLKTDSKSITASYRIYALVRPQIEILVAADKMNTLRENLTVLTDKIEVRINALKATGKDTAALETTLANTRTKLADAKLQADAAISRMSVLLPDNGDATVARSNRDSLSKSHADIRVGRMDLHVVKENLETLIKQIRKITPKEVKATSTEE